MIIANGDNRFPNIETSTLGFEDNVLTIDGTKVSSAYYQDVSLNADGVDHFYIL